MWYYSTYKWNSNLTPEFDEFLNKPAAWDEMLQIGENAQRSVVGARVHGNPFYDSGDIGWQDSTNAMRDQMEVYRAEDQVRATGGEGQSHGYGFREMFYAPRTMWDYCGGCHIIDADDPELREGGEMYIHRRLTDYLAEPLLQRDESSEAWHDYIGRYVDTLFIQNLETGTWPGALIAEIARQRLQLPYEWFGAPIV